MTPVVRCSMIKYFREASLSWIHIYHLTLHQKKLILVLRTFLCTLCIVLVSDGKKYSNMMAANLLFDIV